MINTKGIEGAVDMIRTAYEQSDKNIEVLGRVIPKEEMDAQMEIVDDIIFDVMATIERLKNQTKKLNMSIVGAVFVNMMNTPAFMDQIFKHPELLMVMEQTKKSIKGIIDAPKLEDVTEVVGAVRDAFVGKDKEYPNYDPTC